MPAWSHLHPAIIHFPIALLLMVPLLMLLSLLWPGQQRGIQVCTFALLIMGTAMACLAVVTGLVVPQPLEASAALRLALEAHERLGKRTWPCC